MCKVTCTLITVLLLLCINNVQATEQPVNFDSAQNKLCWQLIEQKSTGHCKLHFSFGSAQPVTEFPQRDTIGYAVSAFNEAKNGYPTSFQKLEYAMQFFYYSLEKFPVRDSLNYIRSGDGTIQLSMSIRTSRSGGYSFVLADNDSQLRQLVANLQNKHAVKATNYYRNIDKLFAD